MSRARVLCVGVNPAFDITLKLDGLDNDPAIVTAVQNAAKNIAYNVTHSHAMNVGNATVIPITPWWQLVLYGATALFGILTVLFLVLAIVAKKKAKQNA